MKKIDFSEKAIFEWKKSIFFKNFFFGEWKVQNGQKVADCLLDCLLTLNLMCFCVFSFVCVYWQVCSLHNADTSNILLGRENIMISRFNFFLKSHKLVNKNVFSTNRPSKSTFWIISNRLKTTVLKNIFASTKKTDFHDFSPYSVVKKRSRKNFKIS